MNTPRARLQPVWYFGGWPVSLALFADRIHWQLQLGLGRVIVSVGWVNRQ